MSLSFVPQLLLFWSYVNFFSFYSYLCFNRWSTKTVYILVLSLHLTVWTKEANFPYLRFCLFAWFVLLFQSAKFDAGVLVPLCFSLSCFYRVLLFKIVHLTIFCVIGLTQYWIKWYSWRNMNLQEKQWLTQYKISWTFLRSLVPLRYWFSNVV